MAWNNKTRTRSLQVLKIKFDCHELPTSIKIAGRIFFPRQHFGYVRFCYKCLGFNHSNVKCTSDTTYCVTCSSVYDVSHKDCNRPSFCRNCKGNHKPSYKKCPKYVYEQSIHVECKKSHLSRQDAISKLKRDGVLPKFSYASIAKTQPPSSLPAVTIPNPIHSVTSSSLPMPTAHTFPITSSLSNLHIHNSTHVSSSITTPIVSSSPISTFNSFACLSQSSDFMNDVQEPISSFPYDIQPVVVINFSAKRKLTQPKNVKTVANKKMNKYASSLLRSGEFRKVPHLSKTMPPPYDCDAVSHPSSSPESVMNVVVPPSQIEIHHQPPPSSSPESNMTVIVPPSQIEVHRQPSSTIAPLLVADVSSSPILSQEIESGPPNASSFSGSPSFLND